MKIFIILIITLQSFNLLSESVAPHDILIYKNKEYKIYNDILEIYFRKNYNTRPIIEGRCYSSKCELATFEIKNNSLMLKKLIVKRFRFYKDKNGKNKIKYVEVIVKKDIFKNKKKKSLIIVVLLFFLIKYFLIKLKPHILMITLYLKLQKEF